MRRNKFCLVLGPGKPPSKTGPGPTTVTERITRRERQRLQYTSLLIDWNMAVPRRGNWTSRDGVRKHDRKGAVTKSEVRVRAEGTRKKSCEKLNQICDCAVILHSRD